MNNVCDRARKSIYRSIFMDKFLTNFTSIIVEHVYGEHIYIILAMHSVIFLYTNKISSRVSFKALSLVVLVVIEILCATYFATITKDTIFKDVVGVNVSLRS